MINRRIIRIKVFQTLFSYNSGALGSLQEADKDLLHTFDKTYDLYFYFLLLIIELQEFAERKIQKAKTKLLPSDEDLNPNTKFINNKVIVQLKENREYLEYLNNRKYTWTKDSNFLREIFEEFSQTDEYKKYLESDEQSYAIDKNILVFLLNKVLYNSENFYAKLEEESIYWIDNVDFVVKRVVSTIKKYSIGDDMTKPHAPKFKNEDDFEFSKILLHKSILKSDEYSKIVQENVVNWDFDRISFVDKVILQMAVAELLEFPEIPIKVTMNEYIELAKIYGIEDKSANFVNGILDKIVKNLKRKELIKKIGRGLKDK